MTREQKVGTAVLIVLAVATSALLWWVVSLLGDVDWTAGDYGWPDYVVAAGILLGALSYLYDVIRRRNRYKQVTIKSGLRSVDVVGYKDAHIIATVLLETLNEKRAPQ